MTIAALPADPVQLRLNRSGACPKPTYGESRVPVRGAAFFLMY